MTFLTRHRAVGLAASVVVAAAALPATAAAQPWEQVTRTSGSYATALVDSTAQATAVGDVGRYAGIRANFGAGVYGGFIRDVQTNLTTQPGGSATKEVLDFDRAETKALIVREFPGRVELAITPLQGGGTSKVIYTAPVPSSSTAYYYNLRAKLSGDGSTVVAVDRYAKTIVKINVATLARTTLQPTGTTNEDYWELPTQAISDDGTVVSVARPYIDAAGKQGGRVYRGTQLIADLEAPAALSPDGSTIVWRKRNGELAYSWNLRKLATGTTTSFTAPGWPDLWVSSNGTKLLISSGGYQVGPQQFDVATATWTTLTGVYERSFGKVLSRNGRFALGDLLIDRTGADIPGATDPLSGDYYVKLGATYNCGAYPPFGTNWGEVQGTLLTQPVAFAPKSVKATFKLYVDNSLLKTITVLPGQSVQAAFKGSPKYHRIVASVTDELGRVIPGTVERRFAGCA